MNTRLLAVGCMLLCTSAFTPGQSFSYPDFSSTSGLDLNGNTLSVGNLLRMTSVSNQTGTFFHLNQFPVAAGFDTTFSFRIAVPAGVTLGEGMALVIQDDSAGSSAVGGAIWGLGYGNGSNSNPGIRRSVAIEIDTYLDPFLNDTSANEVSVHTRGLLGNNENENFSIGRTTPALSLSSGIVRTMRVQYVPGTLSVYVGNLTTPILTVPYDFSTGGNYLNGQTVGGLGLSGGTAFIGFAAATGSGIYQTTEVLSWDWTSTPLTALCFAGTVGTGSGTPIDVLMIDGSAGNFLRVAEINTYQPFTLTMEQPSSSAQPAPFALFGTFGASSGASSFPLGFGTMCFPFGFPNPAGTFTLTNGFFPDSAAILPATAAPWTFSVPLGAFPTPVTLTLQGVMGEVNGVTTDLRVTNALILDVIQAAPPTLQSVLPSSATPGATITVSGTGFTPGLSLTIDGTNTPVTWVNSTEISFAYPSAVACDAALVLTNPDTQSVGGLLNPTPQVTNPLNPQGAAASGASFIIIGTGFTPGTTVTIGGAPATITTVGQSLIAMTTPPGAVGAATVVITTPGGCTATTTYTYL